MVRMSSPRTARLALIALLLCGGPATAAEPLYPEGVTAEVILQAAELQERSFGILRDKYPADYEKLRQIYATGIKAQTPVEVLRNKALALITLVFEKALTTASDALVIEVYKANLWNARLFQKTDPVTCVALLDGASQVQADNFELNEARRNAVANVLAGEPVKKPHIATEDEASDMFASIAESAGASVGLTATQWLENIASDKMPAAQSCSAWIALYDALYALPAETAAPVQRYLTK